MARDYIWAISCWEMWNQCTEEIRKYNDSGQNFDQNCVCFATTFLHELWQNTSLLCHSERANRGKKYETRLLEKSENLILVHSWTTSRWPPGKWLPRPQKWMKKNSDKSHISSDMLFRRFGGFCDPGDQSSQWKINSPKNFHAQGGRRISLYFLRYEKEIRLRAV